MRLHMQLRASQSEHDQDQELTYLLSSPKFFICVGHSIGQSSDSSLALARS